MRQWDAGALLGRGETGKKDDSSLGRGRRGWFRWRFSAENGFGPPRGMVIVLRDLRKTENVIGTGGKIENNLGNSMRCL